MTPDEARAALALVVAAGFVFADAILPDDMQAGEFRDRCDSVAAELLARPELVLAALGAVPVTTAVAAGEDGNWTEEDQPAWCSKCEEYGWRRPVVMLPEGTEKP